jgi:hypothetical protein
MLMATDLKGYPYSPKSTRRLRPGDFWALPRTDGTFACGRVLQVTGDQLVSPTRAFFGGLLDWVGSSPPTGNAIARASLLDVGIMHIKAILSTGGKVLGNRPLELDDLKIPTLLSAMGGPDTLLLQGVVSVRPATRAEWGTLPVLSYWGFDFISQLADARLPLKPNAG